MTEEKRESVSATVDEATRILFEATPQGQNETQDNAKRAYKELLRTLGKPPRRSSGMNLFVSPEGNAVNARFAWGREISADEVGIGEMGYEGILYVETKQPGMGGKRGDPTYVTLEGVLASDPRGFATRQIILNPDGSTRVGEYWHKKGVLGVQGSKNVDVALPGNFWSKVAEAVKRSTQGPAFRGSS